MLLALHGCVHTSETASPVSLDEVRFTESGAAEVPDAWWTSFDDPELDRLVAAALADNFTVRAAFSRLEAAEAEVVQARAPLFPALSAQARGEVATDAAPGVSLGLYASYEIDLFGALRAELRGEAQRREQTREEARAAALSITGQIARTWVAIGAARAQLALLDEQLTANEGMAQVVEARFLNGVVRQADALRQQRLLVQTQAQRIEQLEDLEVLEHQLAVLLGRPPEHPLDVQLEALPALPALPDAGLPLALVRRRPDVRAAERALYAADADVAVAVAGLFPQLTLSAGLDNVPTSPQELLTGWVASLAGSLLAPLFEAGARRAEVRRTRALLDAEVADYGTVLLTALQEVEDALTRNRRQEQYVTNLREQVELAEQAALGLQAQYTGGLDVGYLDVLQAQTTAQQLRRDLISAHQRQLSVRIDLYLALAGGVQPEETP